MNASFEKNGNFNSNSRIFEAYFTDVETKETALQKLLSVCEKAASFATLAKSRSVLRAIRLLGMAGSLVGFVGIIGAIECGTLGLGLGLLLGSLLIGVEYLCLKKY